MAQGGRGPSPVVGWPMIGPVPTLGDGQVDFEEFVTLLGPKLSTSGIPEKFHGTDFDTVFWKVCTGGVGLRVVPPVEGCTGPVNGQGHTVKGDDYPRCLSPGCLSSQRARGPLGEAGVVKDSRNGASCFRSPTIWRRVPGPVQLRGAGW